MSLRHHSLQVLDVTGKLGGRFATARGDLFDLSGGALAQSLVSLPPLGDDALTAVMPSGGFESLSQREYESAVLARTFPDGGALWASSGSDAMEAALWALETFRREHEDRAPARHWVRRGGYHGNTYLMRALSTRNGAQKVAGVSVEVIDEHDPDVHYVPFEGPVRSLEATRLMATLQAALTTGRLRAFDILVLESLPTTGYVFQYGAQALGRLLHWCRANSILTILDEVAAGGYRHGRFSVLEALSEAMAAGSQDIALPDATVLAKGLTSGAFPLSAALVSEHIAAAIRRRPSKPISFTHGLTEPAARVALSVFHRQSGRVRDNAAERGVVLHDAFERLGELARHKPGSIGVMSSPTTIRLDIPAARANDLYAAMLRNGLWCYIGRTTFPVRQGAAQRAFVHICPPFDLEQQSVELALATFVRSARETLS
jgi:adenosylmethionine-8-amino-7-oxononanoate aminotransferase